MYALAMRRLSKRNFWKYFPKGILSAQFVEVCIVCSSSVCDIACQGIVMAPSMFAFPYSGLLMVIDIVESTQTLSASAFLALNRRARIKNAVSFTESKQQNKKARTNSLSKQKIVFVVVFNFCVSFCDQRRCYFDTANNKTERTACQLVKSGNPRRPPTSEMRYNLQRLRAENYKTHCNLE